MTENFPLLLSYNGLTKQYQVLIICSESVFYIIALCMSLDTLKSNNTDIFCFAACIQQVEACYRIGLYTPGRFADSCKICWRVFKRICYGAIELYPFMLSLTDMQCPPVLPCTLLPPVTPTLTFAEVQQTSSKTSKKKKKSCPTSYLPKAGYIKGLVQEFRTSSAEAQACGRFGGSAFRQVNTCFLL